MTPAEISAETELAVLRDAYREQLRCWLVYGEPPQWEYAARRAVWRRLTAASEPPPDVCNGGHCPVCLGFGSDAMRWQPPLGQWIGGEHP
jgi:hypothetical protein